MILGELQNPGRLYFPADCDECADRWGANCGPAALAAIAKRNVQAIRGVVSAVGFEKRQYMNPTHMQAALKLMSIPFASSRAWPNRGLVFIQWGGPWLKPGVPIGAAYRHTHWIAVDGMYVFDVNASHLRKWITRDSWGTVSGLAEWIMKHIPRCDGTWSVRSVIAIPE